MTQRGKYFQATEDYVNKVCQSFIAPSEMFRKIECKHHGAEGIAYIKVTDWADDSYYYDITGFNLNEISFLVASIVSGKPACTQIKPFEHRKEVAKIFK